MKNYEIVWDVFGLREVRLYGLSVRCFALTIPCVSMSWVGQTL